MLVSQIRLGSFDSLREKILAQRIVREKIPTSVDLPHSNESKRVLAYSAEEAARLGHKHIGTEHLLLGLLREENCFAEVLLKENGAEIDKVREQVGKLNRGAESASQA